MHPHEALVRTVFDRLAARDAEGVARCYHPDIFYSSPLFAAAHGPVATDAWRVAFARIDDLELTVTALEAGADGAVVHWHARYTFRGRRVAHAGRSLFAFRGGAISRHYDTFSLWRWLAQAFGTPGWLLGWFGPLRWKVRHDARRALEQVTDSRA